MSPRKRSAPDNELPEQTPPSLDGVTEVVDSRPKRKIHTTAEVEEAAKMDASGRLSAMRAAGARHRKEFVRFRNAQGSVQISLPHLPVFDALWRLWAQKRANGEPDPGVTKSELAAFVALEPAKINHILLTFRRVGIARSVLTHVGLRGTKSRYYPMEQGIQLFSLAEALGYGSAVQVGHTANRWRARNLDEPNSIFSYAILHRGSADPLPRSPGS